ncbi:MAG: ribosomal L7Ae/L30e/S12e/Gadd45 family protein [Nitrososphaeraceae archaeon]
MKTLEKIIKESISSNKYKNGLKEVKNNIKGSSLIILSNSLNDEDIKNIESSAQEHNVKVFRLNDSSIKLGKICRKPYKISCISIRGISEDDIKSISKL